MNLRFLAFLALVAAWPRDVQASTAIALNLETLAQRADAVAIVVPEEKRSAWEDGRIATYTRVRVARAYAGKLGDASLWVRTLGGTVGDVGQFVEGEASLPIGQPAVTFLTQKGGVFHVTGRAQGEYAIVGARLTRATWLAHLVDRPGTHETRAVDELADRPLEDSVTRIARAWRRTHGA
jgi:hypothetical protein